MSLSDTTIKNAKPDPSKPKGYKIADEKGMYLLVMPNGSKYFRLKYRIHGKEKVFALGVYPETSLKQAREKRDIAKAQIADGIDPSLDRKIKKLGAGENTFQAIALEWYEKGTINKSDSHKKRTMRILENDLFPWLGYKPIAELKTPELLVTLQRIEDRNAIETTHRALWISGQIFRYAIASSKAEIDITQALIGALKQPTSSNFASLTDPSKIKALLQSIYS